MINSDSTAVMLYVCVVHSQNQKDHQNHHPCSPAEEQHHPQGHRHLFPG